MLDIVKIIRYILASKRELPEYLIRGISVKKRTKRILAVGVAVIISGGTLYAQQEVIDEVKEILANEGINIYNMYK